MKTNLFRSVTLLFPFSAARRLPEGNQILYVPEPIRDASGDRGGRAKCTMNFMKLQRKEPAVHFCVENLGASLGISRAAKASPRKSSRVPAAPHTCPAASSHKATAPTKPE